MFRRAYKVAHTYPAVRASKRDREGSPISSRPFPHRSPPPSSLPPSGPFARTFLSRVRALINQGMNYGFMRSPNWIRRPVEARSASQKTLLAIHLGVVTCDTREKGRKKRSRVIATTAELRVVLSTCARQDEFIDVSRVEVLGDSKLRIH